MADSASSNDAASSNDVAPTVRGVTLDGVLGRGATGIVRLGMDDATGHRVAVKIIDRGFDRTRTSATGFGTESDSLVRLFRAGRSGDGRTCLVMEYCPGGSLADQVVARGGQLDLEEVVCVLHGVVQGLSALHGRGLVHGDLSPSNILFTGLGQPLLADLDAIGRVGEPPPAHVSAGFADEAATVLDPGVDVYGLGALGWFMLTGEAPGPSTSRLPLPALRTDTPPALAELLVSCLSPSARRPSLADFQTRLGELPIEPGPVRLQPVEPALDRKAVITARRRPAEPVVAASERVRAAARRQQELERRRAVRRRRAQVAVGLVVVSGLLVGVRILTEPSPSSAQPAKPSGAASATAAPVPGDPAAAIVELNRRRIAAVIARDATKLADVDAPGSPAMAHDERLIAGFKKDGTRPDGLRVNVLWTTTRTVTSNRATVLLSSVVQPYRQVREADGRLVKDVPRGKITTNLVTLMKKPGGEWRVATVAAQAG